MDAISNGKQKMLQASPEIEVLRSEIHHCFNEKL